MILSYLKVALRNVLRYRLYTLINVLGLAAGLASCLLIGLFIRHELSYDRHYAQADRIYRVSSESNFPTGEIFRGSRVSSLWAARLLQDFPQITQTARLITVNDLLLGREGASSYERQLRFVDAAFFELFDFEWLLGDPSTALGGAPVWC